MSRPIVSVSSLICNTYKEVLSVDKRNHNFMYRRRIYLSASSLPYYINLDAVCYDDLQYVEEKNTILISVEARRWIYVPVIILLMKSLGRSDAVG